MVEVYYYVPADEVDNAVECGLKLSRWYDKEVVIAGDSKKCISVLLNPKDDMEKYKSETYRCVKLELAPDYCYVADKYLYQVGLEIPQVMDIYMRTIVPIKDYMFGAYRLPECLVTSTVIGDHISLLNKRLDSPVLFDNSEELYVNNIIETYKEQHEDFADSMLYYFYCSLVEKGKFEKFEDREGKISVFMDKRSGKAYTIKVPNMDKY